MFCGAMANNGQSCIINSFARYCTINSFNLNNNNIKSSQSHLGRARRYSHVGECTLPLRVLAVACTMGDFTFWISPWLRLLV